MSEALKPNNEEILRQFGNAVDHLSSLAEMPEETPTDKDGGVTLAVPDLGLDVTVLKTGEIGKNNGRASITAESKSKSTSESLSQSGNIDDVHLAALGPANSTLILPLTGLKVSFNSDGFYSSLLSAEAVTRSLEGIITNKNSDKVSLP